MKFTPYILYYKTLDVIIKNQRIEIITITTGLFIDFRIYHNKQVIHNVQFIFKQDDYKFKLRIDKHIHGVLNAIIVIY